MKERIGVFTLAVLAVIVLVQLVVSLSAPVSAYDAKVGSDSATVSVATSADGQHVYVCDGKRCYGSHDGGRGYLLSCVFSLVPQHANKRSSNLREKLPNNKYNLRKQVPNTNPVRRRI